MDISKYIGLFLLKNDYCYLPGIGNLEIKRKPAVYNATAGEMESPKYELIYTQSIGSIDDQMANFIANNERVSIAHAANAIREFCSHAKHSMNNGNALEIPGIGRFISNGGDIQFVQDANLHIEGKSIPFFKTSTRVEEAKEVPISEIYQQTSFKEPKADEEIVLQAPQVNWGKIVLLGLLGLLLLGGAGFLFWYYTQNKETIEPAPQQTVSETPVTNTDTTVQNTNPPTDNIVATTGSKVIINQYDNQAKADKRFRQLQSYGHTVEMVQKDSVYYIVMPVAGTVTNQEQYVDSLKRLFGSNVRMME